MGKGRVQLSGRTEELGDISERILPAIHGERASGNGSGPDRG